MAVFTCRRPLMAVGLHITAIFTIDLWVPVDNHVSLTQPGAGINLRVCVSILVRNMGYLTFQCKIDIYLV